MPEYATGTPTELGHKLSLGIGGNPKPNVTSLSALFLLRARGSSRLTTGLGRFLSGLSALLCGQGIRTGLATLQTTFTPKGNSGRVFALFLWGRLAILDLA